MLCGKHLIIALVDKRRLCSNVMWGTAPALQRGTANCLSTMCGCGGAYTGDNDFLLCVMYLAPVWLDTDIPALF